jgi:RNA polymerase I-specific transcription initiation factor RRN5
MLTCSRACTSCQKYKQKCDRETPCGNCVRRKTGECVYPRNSVKPETGEQQDQSEQPGRVTASILEAIPEATLLHPQIMLILSKTLFMNRSPTIPSPWPHWSEYTSEFATEPAIYRTAFNDFHTLVVSVTRRLMQTAITQATSRLRSRRQRIKKGAIPLVKKKDVLAAIDMVGMKRDGKERWKGVARRCGLRVYDGKWSRYRNNRTRREVPWDEVEHILTVVEPLSEPLTTDADTSDNDAPNFKSRAGRSGTPLPMEQLALSDEHDDEESVDDSEELLSDEEERAHTVPPSRDFMGRYTSVPPTATDRQPASNVMTLEQFDKEAGRQEEHNLCKMLGLEPPNKDKEVKSDEDSDGDDFEHDDKITTHPNGWRSWVDYHAEWEDSSTPISPAEFTTNQKPLGAPPLLPPKTLIQAVSGSDDGIQGARAAESSSGDELDTNMSRQRSQRRSKHNAQQAIKLHARSALAYAALQSRAPQSARSANESKNDDTSDNNDAEENLPYRSPGAGNRLPPIDVPFEDDTSDADVDHPAQSVETGSKHSPVMVSEDESSDISVEMDRPKRSFETETRRPPVSNSDDEMGEMDWDTYIE